MVKNNNAFVFFVVSRAHCIVQYSQSSAVQKFKSLAFCAERNFFNDYHLRKNLALFYSVLPYLGVLVTPFLGPHATKLFVSRLRKVLQKLVSSFNVRNG